MVDQLIRGISGWPAEDRRAIALALVKRLSVTDLAELANAATARLHKEADKRKGRVSKASR